LLNGRRSWMQWCSTQWAAVC